MSSTFELTCLALITLGIWIGLAGVVWAVLQIRATLRAVEALAHRLGESAEKLHHISSQIQDFSTHVRSGWMKVFELAVGAAQTMWKHREREGSRTGDGENER